MTTHDRQTAELKDRNRRLLEQNAELQRRNKELELASQSVFKISVEYAR